MSVGGNKLQLYYKPYSGGELVKISSGGELSSGEIRDLKRAEKESQLKNASDHLRARELCAAKVYAWWAQPGDFLPSEYLKVKQINLKHPVFSRMAFEFGASASNQAVVCVPMVDWAGEIWNAQFIVDGEAKLNWPGAKTKGLFAYVAGDTNIIYLSEGFATAASVACVSGQMSLCAFGVSNLESVLRGLLERYEARAIRLVCDWDAGTLIKKGFNPGLKMCVGLAKKYRVDMCLPFDRLGEWPAGRNLDASDVFIKDRGELMKGLDNPIFWGEL